MSLDALRDQLRVFIPDLEAFTDHLRQVNTALAGAEAELTGLWEDSFQHRFQQDVTALTEPLERFATADATRFLDFLESKRIHVERYLDG